jgi:hypothetical protein
MVDVAIREAGHPKASVDRAPRGRRGMLFPRQSLFLNRDDQLAIPHDARGGVVIEEIDPKNIHLRAAS